MLVESPRPSGLEPVDLRWMEDLVLCPVLFVLFQAACSDVRMWCEFSMGILLAVTEGTKTSLSMPLVIRAAFQCSLLVSHASRDRVHWIGDDSTLIGCGHKDASPAGTRTS